METGLQQPVSFPETAVVRSRQQEVWSGFRGVIPLLLGAAPFGLIYGVLAVTVGLPPAMAQGMSVIIFAGSAQFITVQLLQDGTPLLVIAVTAAVLNVRHVLYSASLAPHLQHLNRSWKALLAYSLTDESYAVAIMRYWNDNGHSDSHHGSHHYKHWYVLGTGFGLWLVWQMSTAVGVFLGAQIPAAWSLDFAAPLTFIALVVPALRSRAMVGAATAAGLIALLTLALPLKLGLVSAMVIGIGVGWLLQTTVEREKASI